LSTAKKNAYCVISLITHFKCKIILIFNFEMFFHTVFKDLSFIFCFHFPFQPFLTTYTNNKLIGTLWKKMKRTLKKIFCHSKLVLFLKFKARVCVNLKKDPNINLMGSYIAYLYKKWLVMSLNKKEYQKTSWLQRILRFKYVYFIVNRWITFKKYCRYLLVIIWFMMNHFNARKSSLHAILYLFGL
jgi:hypothetical protein